MSSLVYTFLDADGQPLYVGCTRNIQDRIYDHRGKTWWLDVASIELVGPTTREIGRAIERHLIGALEPPYNKVHTAAWRAQVGAKNDCTLTSVEVEALAAGWVPNDISRGQFERFWTHILATPRRERRSPIRRTRRAS